MLEFPTWKIGVMSGITGAAAANSRFLPAGIIHLLMEISREMATLCSISSGATTAWKIRPRTRVSGVSMEPGTLYGALSRLERRDRYGEEMLEVATDARDDRDVQPTLAPDGHTVASTHKIRSQLAPKIGTPGERAADAAITLGGVTW